VLDETEIDRRALLRFLAATTDPPRRVWKPVGNWRAPDTAEDVTQWSGVRTELFPRVRTHDEKTGELLTPVRVPRVTYLDASNKQAQGEFPGAAAFALGAGGAGVSKAAAAAALAKMTKKQRREMGEWFGDEPSLGRALVHLKTVYLHDNKLDGDVGGLPNWSVLHSLVTLDLSGNTLRGRLDALRLPPTLKVLNLDQNYFKGPIDPLWFWGIPNVEILRLSGNRLKCAVPKRCWHYLPKLTALYLAQTMLKGGVPKSVADAKELEVLDLSENDELDGEVPTSLLELRRLVDFRLVGCHRMTDTNGVLDRLRERDVEVVAWGAGVPPPKVKTKPPPPPDEEEEGEE
jgi:hypothetical protein